VHIGHLLSPIGSHCRRRWPAQGYGGTEHRAICIHASSRREHMRSIFPFFVGLLLTIGGTVSPFQVHAQPSNDGQGALSFTPDRHATQWYCPPQRHCDPSDCAVTSALSSSSTSASFILTATTTTPTALYVEYEPTDPVAGVPRLRSLPSTCGTSH